MPYYCPITAPFNALFLLNLLILLIILLFSFFFCHKTEKVKRFFRFGRTPPRGDYPQAVHLDQLIADILSLLGSGALQRLLYDIPWRAGLGFSSPGRIAFPVAGDGFFVLVGTILRNQKKRRFLTRL